MKIGLASYRFLNGDIAFNLSQIERAMKAVQGTADLLCFGEAFLQGFDALNWHYAHDRQIAVPADAPVMQQLCRMTVQYQVDLLLGYLERAEDCIYSSCAVIERGALLHNYRRISKGWKEFSITGEHYREGSCTEGFLYRGRRFSLALCGDLWEFPERFRTDSVLLWPIYVNFSLEDWPRYEAEYAAQARLVARQTLMVNSISEDPVSYGGAFCFTDGKLTQKTAYGREEILLVEL